MAAPIFYELRKARLPRLPLRAQGAALRDARSANSPRALGGSLTRDGPLPASRRVPVRRGTRPRDAHRAAAHQAKLASVGLRLRARPFIPECVPVGGGAGYAPGRWGRPGRKARVMLHPGRAARRHAIPGGSRAEVEDGTAASSPLVSWALRLLRQLRLTRCPLSRYVESTTHAPPPSICAREGDPLPCPPVAWRLPPLPRARRRRPAWALHAASQVWTNCIVATLSHLAMGRASVAPPHARAGAPMSPAQDALWRSVQSRVLTFLRTAKAVEGGAKLATAEAEVAEVERLLAEELAARGGYGDGVNGASLGPRDAGLAPLVAQDVALPKRGAFFDLAAFLPEEGERAAFEDPDTLLVGGDSSGEPPSQEVPRGAGLPRSELIALCARLDEAGILALVPAHEAEDISPIFAVRKKFDSARGTWSLRLLFDRRRRNARERHLAGASRELPHAACFLDIVLAGDEHIEIDASDLECFYYTARVSTKRAARNVFGRPLRASSFAGFACFDPAFGDQLVVPALATLAMGDRNAVDFAQRAHRELLRRAGALDPGCEVRYGAPLPRSRTLHGLMIDDRLSVSIVSPDAEGKAAAARARREWDAAMKAYANSCGVPVADKTQRRARAGRVWGAWLDGQRGTLEGPPERRAALALLSLRLAVCGWASPALVKRLLGSWVFHLMFRRAAFAIPDEAFRFAQCSSDPTRVTRLPPAVRSELTALALVAPLLVTNLRAPVASRLWCADASPTAGALVRAELPPAAARELWRHRDSRGDHVRLTPTAEAVSDLREVESPESALLLQAVVDTIGNGDPLAAELADAYRRVEDAGLTRPLHPEPSVSARRDAWVLEAVQSLPFTIALAYPFKRRDHINILEANVRLSFVKLLARSPASFGTRHLLGQDSRVCLGAFAKGRSSARRLNHIESKACAYELAADLQVGGLWVDSFRMPADAPTRGGGIVAPVPARPWVAAFLAGDLSALDARISGSLT